MAYKGGRRACVMLFTDGKPNSGTYQKPEEIVEKIVNETAKLKASSPASQVELHTFGIFGYQDSEGFLLSLARRSGEGNYYNVDKNTNLATAFAYVVSNAINQIAKDIQLTILPSSDRVEIKEAMTKFVKIKEANTLVIKIPKLADQQSRHILLHLTVPPTQGEVKYEELLKVIMTYKNTITKKEENGDEYLYVARRHDLNEVNLDVREQLNRVNVAKKLHHVLKYYIKEYDRDGALEQLRKMNLNLKESVTKETSLTMCMQSELNKLIQMVEDNLDTANMPLEESMESHWQEKGGWNSCYLTRKEDTMIKVVQQHRTV